VVFDLWIVVASIERAGLYVLVVFDVQFFQNWFVETHVVSV